TLAISTSSLHDALPILIIIGTFIRGPGWQWFWPGQTWDHNRLIYEVNRDLPDIFGIGSNLVKAIFGAIVVGGYYVIGGFIFHALFRRYNPKDYQRMSLLQYSIMQFFILTMVALPIKMLLVLVFGIKYVWITPWFNVCAGNERVGAGAPTRPPARRRPG